MITVLGLGFVGLTTALGFSEKGFKVFIWDPFDYFYKDKKEFSDLDSNGLRFMRDQDHLSKYGIDLAGKDLKQFLLDTKLIN